MTIPWITYILLPLNLWLEVIVQGLMKGDYDMSKREEYQKLVRDQLDEWNKELEKLQADVEKAGKDAGEEMHRQVERLEYKISQGEDTLDEFTNTGEEALDEIVKGLDNAWDSLKEAFREAGGKFKD